MENAKRLTFFVKDMARKDRPLLVSIISALQMMLGILILITGLLVALLFFGIFGAIPQDIPPILSFLSIFGAAISFVGLIVLFIGILIFLLGRGLWQMKRWAWAITTILYIFAVLGSYDTILFAIQTGLYGTLFTPLISILLLIYFISIRDKF